MQFQKHRLFLGVVCLVCLLGTVLLAVPAQARPFAYVTNSSSSSVSVIDTATNTVIAKVVLESFPQGLAIIPDGSRVYVRIPSPTPSR